MVDISKPSLSGMLQSNPFENGPNVNQDVGILFSKPCAPVFHEEPVFILVVLSVRRVDENQAGPKLTPSRLFLFSPNTRMNNGFLPADTCDGAVA